jgi:alpha-beta hydrolase superfamily lysophospholipase
MTTPAKRNEVLMTSLCQDIRSALEPQGSAFDLSFTGGSDYTNLPARFQAVPVYVLNGADDRVLEHGMVNGVQVQADRSFEAQHAAIRATCPCNATTVLLAGDGHHTLAQTDAPAQMQAVLDWLADVGLGPSNQLPLPPPG